FGPAIGGLFLAFPAIFPASATLVEKHEIEKKAQKALNGQERGRDAAALDAAGAVMGSVGLVLFALFVWLLLPRHSSWLILASAAMLWFVSSCCLWFLREHRHQIFRSDEIEKKAQKALNGQERGRDAAALDAAGAVMGSVGLVLFALFVWLLLPRHSSWLILASAAMLWFVSSCCLWFLREHRHQIF